MGKKGQIPWNLGKKHSEETKRKIAEKAMGRKCSEETRKKLSEAGKNRKLTEEHKRKIGDAHRGRKASEEQKKKQSIAMKGKYIGDKCYNWKGGKHIAIDGYVLIYSPEHPFADVRKTVREHRLVMEKHIGRYLKPKEVVHHINGNKSDNRIENLMLFSSGAEHTRYHNENTDNSCI